MVELYSETGELVSGRGSAISRKEKKRGGGRSTEKAQQVQSRCPRWMDRKGTGREERRRLHLNNYPSSHQINPRLPRAAATCIINYLLLLKDPD